MWKKSQLKIVQLTIDLYTWSGLMTDQVLYPKIQFGLLITSLFDSAPNYLVGCVIEKRLCLPSTSPSSSSASSLRLLVFSTIEEKHDSDLGLGNTGKKAVVVSISLPIFWCKSLITCKLLGSEMAGLIGFPSASLRCGPMKIKKGKIINYNRGNIRSDTGWKSLCYKY